MGKGQNFTHLFILMRKFKKPFHTSSPNWHSKLPKTKACCSLEILKAKMNLCQSKLLNFIQNEVEDIMIVMTLEQASLWPRKRNASVLGAASALKGFGVSIYQK